MFLAGASALVYMLMAMNRFGLTPQMRSFALSSSFYAAMLIASWMLTIGISRTLPAGFFYLLIIAVPLEFSAPLGRLPLISLSPIDIFCLCALVAMVSSPKRRLLFFSLTRTERVFWGLFLVWESLDALWQHGNQKPMLRWGEFLFVYMAASAINDSLRAKLRLNTAQLAACLGVIASILGVFQYIVSRGDYMAATGTFGQHNSLGVFLSLTLGAAVGLWLDGAHQHPRVWAIASLLIWIGLLTTFSRGAWIGVGTAIFFGLARRWQDISRWIPGHRALFATLSILTIAILSMLFIRSPRRLTTLSQRQRYWAAAKNVIFHHPLVGLGPGNYEKEIRSYLDGDNLQHYDFEMRVKGHIDFWQHLHNLYLQLAVDSGLIGLLLWLTAIGLGLWHSLPGTPGRPESNLILCLWMSAIAFLVHNAFDIATVNSFDLLFAIWLAFSRRNLEPAFS